MTLLYFTHTVPQFNARPIELILNKKVLLRERKRHTARCVANTPYVVLTGYPPGGSRYPPPGGVPGTPPRVPTRGGTQNPRGGGGTWYTPPGWGGTRVPPLPLRCGQTNKVKLLPSRRTTYAGGKYELNQCISISFNRADMH